MHSTQTISMPGHWLLARAGKRVLRPGGAELTDRMLTQLAVGPEDRVVELAPGLGHTAVRLLALRPASYIGVDREYEVTESLQARLGSDRARFVQGRAEDTGLPGEFASVVFGEAMMSMQRDAVKRAIVGEAWRVLRRGGRYGIHELCLSPDDIPLGRRRAIEAELARVIHHGVVPLTGAEWKELLEAAGFTVTAVMHAPMHLLEPWRVVRDEGLCRTALIAARLIANPEALRRVRQMRSAFRSFASELSAVSIVAEKRH